MDLQFVAGPGALTTQAESLAGGLGSYAPLFTSSPSCNGAALHISSTCLHINKMLLESTLQEFDIQAQKGAQQD
jgi:hypothetical protein